MFFLVKKNIESGKREFIRRTYRLPNGEKRTYLDELLEIGIVDIESAWNEVLALTPNHYYAGPIEDHDTHKNKDSLWIYKKEINEICTYIKLKLDESRGTVCISFHMDRPKQI